MATIRTNFSKIIAATGANCFGGTLEVQGNTDITIANANTGEGTGMFVNDHGSVAFPSGNLRIRGAFQVGISLLNESTLRTNTGRLTLDNGRSAADPGDKTGLMVGTFGRGGCSANVLFGDLKIPSGTNSFIAEVEGGSLLEVRDMSGVSIGQNSNGFRVLHNSSLIWSASADSNILGNSQSTQGTLFNLRDNSTMTMSGVRASTFTNYREIFIFDTNSRGFINNSDCTTLPGGTNVTARDLSRVFVGDNVRFNASGNNRGFFSANGAYTEATGIINQAAQPIVPAIAQVPLGANIGSYNATAASGVVVQN